MKSPEKTKKGGRKLQAKVTSPRKLSKRKRKSRDDHVAVAFVEEDSVVVMETEDMEVTFPSQENTSEGESSKSAEAGPSGESVNNNAMALGKQKIRKHKIKRIPDEEMDHENDFQRVDQVSQSRSRSRSRTKSPNRTKEDSESSAYSRSDSRSSSSSSSEESSGDESPEVFIKKRKKTTPIEKCRLSRAKRDEQIINKAVEKLQVIMNQQRNPEVNLPGPAMPNQGMNSPKHTNQTNFNEVIMHSPSEMTVYRNAIQPEAQTDTNNINHFNSSSDDV